MESAAAAGMIAHGATIAAIFVAILSVFESARVADGYVLPTPTFEILQPSGIRIWIPHEEGMQFFAFHGNVNTGIGPSAVGVISGEVYRQRGMKWTVQKEGVNVRDGDTINYWMYVQFNGSSYKTNNLTIIHVKRDEKSMATRLVFNETFDSLNQSTWERVIKFPLGPDFEFCVYHNANHGELAEIVDGVLRIKPLILEDYYGEGATTFGNTELGGCTSTLPAECKRKATAFNILPPVISARFTTKESFNFRYGKIEIRAKFPEGDWLYPEMWLEPSYDNNYGAGYSSGRVLLGLARGNEKLINATSGEIFDSRKLEFGFRIGAAGNVESHMVSKIEETNPKWTKEFHVYTTIWNSDGFQFLVDYEEVGKLVPGEKGWMNNQFNKMAPFDQEFYITIGIGVGGIRIFPDGTISSGIAKPWRNLGAKAMLQFWRAKNQWLPSWKRQNGKKAAFEIDYIRVWSFN